MIEANQYVRVGHDRDKITNFAHSCPGSSLFLFEGPQTLPGSPYANTPERVFRYLHCGDVGDCFLCVRRS